MADGFDDGREKKEWKEKNSKDKEYSYREDDGQII